MADKTSTPSKNISPCSENCSKTGGVCIKQELDGKGVCVVSTTRYFTFFLIFRGGKMSALGGLGKE